MGSLHCLCLSLSLPLLWSHNTQRSWFLDVSGCQGLEGYFPFSAFLWVMNILLKHLPISTCDFLTSNVRQRDAEPPKTPVMPLLVSCTATSKFELCKLSISDVEKEGP